MIIRGIKEITYLIVKCKNYKKIVSTQKEQKIRAKDTDFRKRIELVSDREKSSKTRTSRKQED